MADIIIGSCRVCGGLSHVTRTTESFSIFSPNLPVERTTIEVLHDDCIRCGYRGQHLEALSADLDGKATIELLFSFLTASPREREIAADHLICEFYDPEHHDRLIAALLKMAKEDDGTEHRAVIITLLSKMAVELSSAAITDLLFANTGAAFEQALELVHNDQYELNETAIAEQIIRIEDYLTAHRSEWDTPKYQGMRDAHFQFAITIAKPIQPLPSTRWPLEPWPIAYLNAKVADLAKHLGYRLDRWGDATGERSGFALILPSGLWVRFSEDAAQTHTDVELGIEPVDHVDSLLNEVLGSLRLSADAISSKRIGQTDCWT